MRPNLHILTACSRPDNLAAVAASVGVAAASEQWNVCWHVRYDLERQHIGGQKLKNDMLDQITEGWVCFLDDDTLLHPGLLEVVANAAAVSDAVVVSQDRADGRHLQACPENVRIGYIDIGQAVLRRDLIFSHRIPENYEGDGWFLTAVLAGARVTYVDAVLSHHNLLEQVPA